jgi:hypothetical protein
MAAQADQVAVVEQADQLLVGILVAQACRDKDTTAAQGNIDTVLMQPVQAAAEQAALDKMAAQQYTDFMPLTELAVLEGRELHTT